MGRLHVLTVFSLAMGSAVFGRTPVSYTGTAGAVDLLAVDVSGVDALLLTAPAGPTSFGIGGSVTTPSTLSGMAGDSTVGLGAYSMTAVVAVLGGSVVGGALSGTATADIFFTLSLATEGTFSAGFTIFDPHPFLTTSVTLLAPDAASAALGTHMFSAGAYHLHVEATFIGMMFPPDTSGHVVGGSMISFVPMPAPVGLGAAGLMAVAAIRRRR